MPQRPHAARQMRLTEQHVALLDPGEALAGTPVPPPHTAAATTADHHATIERLFAGHEPGEEVWFFAYGSLIWKPACEFVELRTGLLHGWRRSFCLGWNETFRGNPTHPGLMLALDRGGSCHGALYRLPPDAVESNLIRLFEREMGWRPTPFPPRWVTVRSGERAVRALTFCVDRHSGRYVSGLSEDQIADVLATATGPGGSMAEYLYATVSHLEQLGILDHHLWRLQELTAARIEAAHGVLR